MQLPLYTNPPVLSTVRTLAATEPDRPSRQSSEQAHAGFTTVVLCCLTYGWVATSPGEDRREKLVRLTEDGAAKLKAARPAWERAQERLRSRLPEGTWSGLLHLLPELTHLADTG